MESQDFTSLDESLQDGNGLLVKASSDHGGKSAGKQFLADPSQPNANQIKDGAVLLVKRLLTEH